MRVQLFEFAQRVDREIDSNSFKGDWRSVSASELLNELLYHVAKLGRAHLSGDDEACLEYAADCAALAYMFADNRSLLPLPPSTGERFEVYTGGDTSVLFERNPSPVTEVMSRAFPDRLTLVDYNQTTSLRFDIHEVRGTYGRIGLPYIRPDEQPASP